MASQPTLMRMKPSAMASPPQRARRSAVEVTPPKLVASVRSFDLLRKVSAAWLVEQSGFSKGYGNGRVGISHKHALAIVNRGGATAAEVLALKYEIQSSVEEQWGIRLEMEPVIVASR